MFHGISVPHFIHPSVDDIQFASIPRISLTGLLSVWHNLRAVSQTLVISETPPLFLVAPSCRGCSRIYLCPKGEAGSLHSMQVDWKLAPSAAAGTRVV